MSPQIATNYIQDIGMIIWPDILQNSYPLFGLYLNAVNQRNLMTGSRDNKQNQKSKIGEFDPPKNRKSYLHSEN